MRPAANVTVAFFFSPPLHGLRREYAAVERHLAAAELPKSSATNERRPLKKN